MRGSSPASPSSGSSEPKHQSHHRKLLSVRSISATQLSRLRQHGQQERSDQDGQVSSSAGSNGRVVASPVKLRLLGRSSTSEVGKQKQQQQRSRDGAVVSPSALPSETSRTRVGLTEGSRRVSEDAVVNISGRSSTERPTATAMAASEQLVQHALYPPSLLSSPSSSPLIGGSGARTLHDNSRIADIRPPPRSQSSRTLRSGTSDRDSAPHQLPTSTSRIVTDRLPVSPLVGGGTAFSRPDDMSGSSAPATPVPAASFPPTSNTRASESTKMVSSSVPASFSTLALSSVLNAPQNTSQASDARGSPNGQSSRSRTTSRSTGREQNRAPDNARAPMSSALSSAADAVSGSGKHEVARQTNDVSQDHDAPSKAGLASASIAASPARPVPAETSASDSNASSTVIKRKKESSASAPRALHKGSLSALGASSSGHAAAPVVRELKTPVLPCADVAASIAAGTSVPWSIGTPYWSLAPVWGKLPSRPMRAHSATLVELASPLTTLSKFPSLTANMEKLGPRIQLPALASLWVFGGCDAKTCFRDTWVLDLQSYSWSKPKFKSWQNKAEHYPPPLRAHSATFIPPFASVTSASPAENAFSASTDGHLLLFGGGDGPSYFNDIYLLSLRTHTWCKPSLLGKATGQIPPPRRAHAAVYYEKKKWLVLFGGGNGSRALNDTWVLECKYWNEKGLNWRKVETRGKKPKLRGYREFKNPARRR